jgi:hypothetical protein
MLSYSRSELPCVVHARLLASVAVYRDCYSIGYSGTAASLVLVFDLGHRCGRVNEVRPSDGLTWIQGVRETQSRLTVLAQVFRVYLGRFVIVGLFWGHGSSVAASVSPSPVFSSGYVG